jgi:hypothetical protein
VLGALALALKAVGFWLDRFELVFSPRGIVFGAAYTDIYASLPVLGALGVFAALCAVACLAQIARAGLRLVAGGLIALALVWVLGLGIYPALLQRLRVTPNELVAERHSSSTTSARSCARSRSCRRSGPTTSSSTWTTTATS